MANFSDSLLKIVIYSLFCPLPKSGRQSEI